MTIPHHPLTLGLDLGTTNVKALVVSPAGEAIACGAAPAAVRHLPDGAVEQDVKQIWRAALAAIAEAGRNCELRNVRTVGVSSQGGAMQVLTPDGEPLGPVIGWQDARGAEWDRRLTDEKGADWFSQHLGWTRSGLTLGQLCRLRENGALPKAFKLGFVGDVIVGRLCGRRAHDATSLSLGVLYNPRLDAEDPDALALVGLERDQLPALLPAAVPAGGLLPGVAAATGLPAGIPVDPAVHDQYAVAVGAGVVAAGDLMLGTGTAWVLLAIDNRLRPPLCANAFACRHPVPGLYGQMLSMVNGGSCLEWARRTLRIPQDADVDRLLRSVPPGSNGVRCQPLLSPGGGAGLPPGTGGALAGLRLSHSANDILRAIVEGLACELGRYLAMLSAAGVNVDRLVMCGRAATSEITPQIVADTTGLAVDCVGQPETGAFGAAVLGAALLDPDTPLADTVAAMVPAPRHVEPGPNAARCGQLLNEYLPGLADQGL